MSVLLCVLQGLAQLEREISFLGGMCAASLMRKDIVLPPVTAEEMEEDLDLVDEGAQQVKENEGLQKRKKKEK